MPGMIERMFSGVRINTSEQKPALHTAFRDRTGKPVVYDGEDIQASLSSTFDSMCSIAERVRTGDMRGCTGKLFSDVVVIALGSFSTALQLATDALAAYTSKGMSIHFVSSFDASAIHSVLRKLDATSVLVIGIAHDFAETTFQTVAMTAREWLMSGTKSSTCISSHFIAITAVKGSPKGLGVEEANILALPAWINPRYAIWSAAGLPLAIAIGAAQFAQFLGGAHEMDVHYRTAGFSNNLPILLAVRPLIRLTHVRAALNHTQRRRRPAVLRRFLRLSDGAQVIDVWYISFLGATALGVVPFDSCLKALPRFVREVAPTLLLPRPTHHCPTHAFPMLMHAAG